MDKKEAKKGMAELINNNTPAYIGENFSHSINRLGPDNSAIANDLIDKILSVYEDMHREGKEVIIENFHIFNGDFSHRNFSGWTFVNCRFENTDFRNTIFSNAKIVGKIKFENCQMKGSKFANIDKNLYNMSWY